ncbi:hypothetical protein EDC01DRAFT_295919 [Geopyxis carbonaria]|nr:hypothetical protein EDC01DRAFT_295919 [Geopyxis carbonaria]
MLLMACPRSSCVPPCPINHAHPIRACPRPSPSAHRPSTHPSICKAPSPAPAPSLPIQPASQTHIAAQQHPLRVPAFLHSTLSARRCSYSTLAHSVHELVSRQGNSTHRACVCTLRRAEFSTWSRVETTLACAHQPRGVLRRTSRRPRARKCGGDTSRVQ